VLGVTIAGTSAGGASDRADVSPFQSSKPGEYVLAATVNGQGPFAFILDTGSSHSFVTDALAERLGAPAVAKSLVRSSIGLATRPIVRLDDHDVLASLVPAEDLDPARRLAGVIGQDILASRRYTIDLLNRRVTWHTPDTAPHGRTSFALQPADGRFLVELPQLASPALRLVPDSGAEGLVLYQRDQRRLPPFLLSSGRTRLTALTSKADVQPIRVTALQVGPFTFADLPGVVIGRHGATSPDEDGLLPLHLFSRVTFDGPGRRLIVD
jgi:predicted aspartyl protease